MAPARPEGGPRAAALAPARRPGDDGLEVSPTMTLARLSFAPSLLLASLLLAAGCGDGSSPASDAAPDDGATDAAADAMRERHREELPDPEPLTAGIAEVRIPAPVGVGTMGFGPFGVDPSVSPFADDFPATTRAHGELTFRAVALSRGPEHELILVRMDTVGVFQQLREAVLDALEERLGRGLDDALVLAGNHTHSGPGRLLMTTGALTALSDSFFPELYDRVVAALADVVEQALDDRAPAEIGWAIASSSEGHNDRRCENDALDQLQEVPDMPVVGIRRDGQLDAVVASYAYHGTVLGIDDLTLSGDFGSVVEQKTEEQLDHPVMVLFFNSWGADMSPGRTEPDPGAVGADQPEGFERMQLAGNLLADAVVPALEGLSYEADPAVRMRTYRVRIDREALGYDPDTFRYSHGGAFCGAGSDGNCEGSEPIEDLDRLCIRISPAENLPKQTVLGAGRIGDLFLVTGTGEWSTDLANGVLEQVRATSGGEAMFIGYANDYTGYSLGEDDWWQGGYEASGALWGPRQGDYLAARTVEAFETFHDRWVEPPWLEPDRVEPFSGYSYDPYVPETPIGLGTVTADVPATATATDVVTFTVRGADPWLGAPVATLEHDPGGGFEPVTRSNGTVVDSRSYDLWVDLTTEPTYEAQIRADERAFEWEFHFPVAQRAASGIPALSGDYRFRVRVPTSDGEQIVETGTFTVE